MNRLVAAAALLLIVYGGSAPARAWDDNGHRIIAFMAERYIRSSALEQVNALLGADIDHLTTHDLAGAATWADHYLASDESAGRQRYEATVRWHFADIEAVRPNLPKACYGHMPLPKGVLAANGPAEACIIDKIEQFAAELADRNAPRQERLLALKYLLNLVADLHQPMRVADEHDDHGKLVPIAAEGQPAATLFDLWESGLTQRFGANFAAAAQKLGAKTSESEARAWMSGTPQLWALEAHQVGVDLGYSRLGAITRNGQFVIASQDVDDAADAVARQLTRAAVRTAYVINEALAPLPEPLGAKAPKGSVPAGRTFAQQSCSLCHVLDGSQPERFTMAPDFASIANTHGITEEALREFLYGPHPSMPSIILQGNAANDVIAFILSQKQSHVAPKR